MKPSHRFLLATVGAVLLACESQEQATPRATAQSPPAEEMTGSAPARTAPAEPGPASNPLRDAYFGNFHVHTSYSFDGYTNGSVTTPDDAYRWAKGESIPGGGGGGELQIGKPLDWYVVSVHAEYLGVFRKMEDPESPFSELPIAERITSDDQVVAFDAYAEVLTKMSEGESDPALSNPDVSRTIWSEVVAIAEKIYDVALSGDRQPDTSGRIPPVGNTVDVAAATYTNAIGAEQLSAAWTDPDFDPAQPAVYYARVLEIPTPRWSTYDAKTLGVPPRDDLPASIQERAWTSPIWYAP